MATFRASSRRRRSRRSRRSAGPSSRPEAAAGGRGGAADLTQQYVVGELSSILGELQAAATDEAAGRDVARLRREAETTEPAALAPFVVRALELTDEMCWDALTQGEPAAFVREAAICAELWEFGVCAGLLEEGRCPIAER